MDDDNRVPEPPDGVWEGHEGLDGDLSKPHGHTVSQAARRPDTLSHLPADPAPAYAGAYVYLAAVYPLVGLNNMSLWEYYYAQSDIDLKPATYITDKSPILLHGTKFDEMKESHRLHWHDDRSALLLFLEFLQTLLLQDTPRKRVWGLALHEVSMQYPQTGSTEMITCVIVLPYSHLGGFVPVRDAQGQSVPLPVITWAQSDTCAQHAEWKEAQEQLRFDEQDCAGRKVPYLGQRAMPAEAYPFYKAPEIAALTDMIGGA